MRLGGVLQGRRTDGRSVRPVLALVPVAMASLLVTAAMLVAPGAAASAAAVPHLAAPKAALPAAAVDGQATEYGPADGGGACGFAGPPADGLIAAVGPALYDGSAACGTYLEVTGARGSVLVKVQDLCPECGPSHLDLSEEAFRQVDELSRGLVPITFRTVANPPVPGPVSITMKEGVSQWWVSFIVDNHGNELTAVAVRPNGGSWQPMTRHEFNFWESPGDVPEPFAVRVTDRTGAVSELDGLRAQPGAVYTAAGQAAGPGNPPEIAAAPGAPAGPPGSVSGSAGGGAAEPVAAAAPEPQLTPSSASSTSAAQPSAPPAAEEVTATATSGATSGSSVPGALVPATETAGHAEVTVGTPATSSPLALAVAATLAVGVLGVLAAVALRLARPASWGGASPRGLVVGRATTFRTRR